MIDKDKIEVLARGMLKDFEDFDDSKVIEAIEHIQKTCDDCSVDKTDLELFTKNERRKD